MSEGIIIGAPKLTTSDFGKRLKEVNVHIQSIKAAPSLEQQFQHYPVNIKLSALDSTYLLNTLVVMGQTAEFVNDEDTQQRVLGMMMSVLDGVEEAAKNFSSQTLTEAEDGV